VSKHWKNIIAGNETDEEVEAFLNPPDAHEGTMSERVVGPLGHVMREFAAGNPGTQHLVGELAEAHNRLREYEGMMTRREVLEEIAKINRWKEPEGVYQRAWRNGQLITYALCLGIMGFAPEQMLNAAHELALLMNAEREEAQGNE
jgi:hypothetical protein